MRDSVAAARIGLPLPGDDGPMVFGFRFPASDPVFAGHFPGRPILPGVFQIEMVRLAAETVLNFPLGVREIRKAKFQRPIRPDERARVGLRLSEKEGTIEARAGVSVDGQPAGEMVLWLWRNVL